MIIWIFGDDRRSRVVAVAIPFRGMGALAEEGVRTIRGTIVVEWQPALLFSAGRRAGGGWLLMAPQQTQQLVAGDYLVGRCPCC